MFSLRLLSMPIWSGLPLFKSAQSGVWQNLICSEGQSQNCWPILQRWMHAAQSLKKCPVMIWSLRRHLERLQAANPESPKKYASTWHKGREFWEPGSHSRKSIRQELYSIYAVEFFSCPTMSFLWVIPWSRKISKEWVPEYPVWELLSGPSMLYNIAGPDTAYYFVLCKSTLQITGTWKQNSTRSSSHNEPLPQPNQTQNTNMWSANM